MRTDTHVGIFDLFIFLGIFQGLILSWFFIKNSNDRKQANLFQGLLILFLSLTILEELLNNTGFIVKVLAISNFSEPLNFSFGPLVFLYSMSIIEPGKKRKYWVHFIPSMIWLGYMIFYFMQPDENKYNSYVYSKHPDWEYLSVVYKMSEDPIGIRQYVNQLTFVSFTLYLSMSLAKVIKRTISLKQSFFRTSNENLTLIRNTIFHFFMIIAIYLAVLIYNGNNSDIGNQFIATYISFMILVTSYHVINQSDYFSRPQSFLSFQTPKYQKSSLSAQDKEEILLKIKIEMENKKYFTYNRCSLAGFSKNINESVHHVSQVINEKMNKTFFELLAWYRVEEAKKIIIGDADSKITIEELAEKVGYNSKSSFNTAFKKLTSQTPSDFRKLNNSC
ncbi:MAG: helix-turn-helix domain-containing protein [Bacteroidales bacterium]|nr:helix-turn-helix domain-containing protein [Bacteroidales bacterium]